MSNWRKMADRAEEKVVLAGTYLEGGALRTAARCYREAAELLDQAALVRSSEIGDKG